MSSRQAAFELWRHAGMPEADFQKLTLEGSDPVLPSSFAIGTAAQTSIGLAALAAATIAGYRGCAPQSVTVDMTQAALECTGYFSIDGTTPDVWDPIAGLYACGPEGSDGWLRLHTNFEHHRDGVLKLLGLPQGPSTGRQAVAAALRAWEPMTFEQLASEAGLVVAAARTFEQWDLHPQAGFVGAKPLIHIERIGEAPPRAWPDLSEQARPLEGLKVLDLTRILAGPVCGRTLAQHGADVMLVNSPHLPNIASIADTSRGKRSTHIDLQTPEGLASLHRLTADAHVFVQGYRPGAIAKLGFGAEAVARSRPGIVYVSLSAYGDDGPWAGKRGFDSLVQTATGFNFAEAQAAGEREPRALPVQILDYATGFLMAFGAQVALHRQITEGGSWHVRLSLARTGLWLRSLGRVPNGLKIARPDAKSLAESGPSGFGVLASMPHAARFQPPAPSPNMLRPSMPPGSHPPAW